MNFIKESLRYILKNITLFFSWVIPQDENKVLFISPSKIEENALVLANYVSENYNFEVVFYVPKGIVQSCNRIIKAGH